MDRLTHVGWRLVLLLCATVVTGCGPQTDDEITRGEEASRESTAQGEQAGKSNNSDEYYTSAERNPERAKSITESPQSMDVLTPEDPVMAYAHYHTVAFKRGVARLTPGEQSDLRAFITSLEEHQPLYVTVRMEDEDTLDATEPTPEFKKLTASRVKQVADFFERGGVEIAELKVDESGISETPGEDRALARPENGDDKNEQLVVITIKAEENGEPSETIPHSPNVRTIEG